MFFVLIRFSYLFTFVEPNLVYALGTSGTVEDSYAYKSQASDIDSTASKPTVGLQRLFWMQAF